MEIQFCDVCDNLLYKQKKDKVNNTITLMCRQGHVKVLHLGTNVATEPEREIAVGTEISEPGRIQDYDFDNKRASRLIVRKMLESVREKGLVKPFEDQDVLILTHVQGWDLKQCLLPLGYRKENIHVIERDKGVYQEIRENEFFDGCIVDRMELKNFKSKKKYDLIYLDFKSNMCYEVFDIIRRLLMFNSHDGTAFYINLQMARETDAIMTMYYDLENSLMEECDQRIEMGHEAFVEFKDRLEGAIHEANRIGSGLEIKINGKRYRFKEKGKPVDPAVVEKSLIDVRDRFQTINGTEVESKKTLECRENYHVLRQKALKLYIKTVLNAFLIYTEDFTKYDGKKQFTLDLEVDPFAIDDLTPRRMRLVPIMRYMGKTLNPLFFSNFIYQSDHRPIPFMNTFFVLKSQDGILDDIGFNNFSEIIAECFMIFNLKAKGMVRDSSMLRSIVNYTLLEEFMMGNVESDEDVTFFDQEHQNDIRHKLNLIRQAYVDMKDLNILKIDDDGMLEFHFLDSSLKVVDYKGDYSRLMDLGKAGKLRDRKAKVSSPVLMFYLLFKFLNILEKEIGKTVEVSRCHIVSVKNGDVDGEVDRAFNAIFEEDPLFKEASTFKGYITGVRSRLDVLKKMFNGRRDTVKNAHSRLEELIYDDEILESFKRLFKQVSSNGGGIMENHDVDHLTDEQLKQVIREFVAGNYDTNATIIAGMVNEHVKDTHGYDPGVTMPMVAAHKYWHRVNVIEKETA